MSLLKEGILDLLKGKDRIEIGGTEPEKLYVAIESVATLARETPTAASHAAPVGNGFTGGKTGRNNGLYAWGAAVAPAKIEL